MKITKSRETFSLNIILHYLTLLAVNTVSGPILGFTFLTCLSATTTGCTVPESIPSGTDSETTMRIMEGINVPIHDIGTLDILIFNDDGEQRLDTYQQLSPASCSTVKAASSAGKKTFFLVANGQRDRYGWAGINYREALKDECIRLEEETREVPVMTGEWRGRAGSSTNIVMKRMSSEIVLRSICCSIEGKDGNEVLLKKVKVYLTNVCAEIPLISEKEHLPRRFINAGRLNPDELQEMAEPRMLMQDIKRDIGSRPVTPGIVLTCYPNEVPQEGIGTPFTRLVIEGQLEGKTYYWPININRSGHSLGVSRNTQYIFDITIRRPGQDDPDIPIELTDIDIKTEVKEWEEREEYGVRF